MPLRDRNRKRLSGVLCAISSLPSNYGIGTFGEQAYKFVDFLVSDKQRFWQILPLNPLGEGNSPYKSTSCYAGEILYIDLDLLIREGLLSEADIPHKEFPVNTDYEQGKIIRGIFFDNFRFKAVNEIFKSTVF